MGRMQREKGKRGEREWAEKLREHGFADARRAEQYRGGIDSHDVEAFSCPVSRWEVKRRERIAVHEVVAQASEVDGAVAWRRDQGKWVVCMDADDFLNLLRLSGMDG